ncbi:MAG: DUF4249 family protein [Bacteroidota bacterium]
MKFIKHIGFALCSALLISSCTKVIDVKLNEAAKKYVIDGTVTDAPGGCKVKISQTKKFSDDNTFPGVSGATVTITDNTGTTTTLTEGAQGEYVAPALVALSGRQYTLKVAVGGQTFTAISDMPQRVALDTLYMTTENLFGDMWTLANIEFNDPAGRGNNYRFRQYVNGQQVKQIFGGNDDYTDGKRMSAKLFIDPGVVDDYKIKSGDTITVDFMCIDLVTYKYWFSLYMSATGNSQSAAPANPVSNIQGGALGCFSAYSLQTRSVVAQ